MKSPPDNDMSQEKTESVSAAVADDGDIPISCELDETLAMFRITRCKSKAMTSGGFGITISSKQLSTKDTSETRNSEIASQEFLFVEEVLFLFQRGLLECTDPSTKSALFESDIFRLLSKMGISLAQYLVFAHLRSQDFRVLRHSPNRLRLLKQQVQSGNETRLEVTTLRHQVRDSIASAPPPTIPDEGLCISWDVYNPNSNFAKTHPGIPDFYVAATFYNKPQVSFANIFAIVHSPDYEGVPLKIATVSDSGTIVMFGVTDFGVQSMVLPVEKQG
eukprot:Nitzschia sp. Nitz4//scaffold1_size375055//138497//139324//NITZ4_000255-RA/size375055-processed-gene-0.340-mRNA-1//1//CDS//3329540982//2846//frame0